MQQLIQFLGHNWAMSAALIIVFAMILFNEIQFLRKKGKEVSPQEVVKLINNDNAIVIDLRPKENHLTSHIIDAVSVTLDEFDKNKMDHYKSKTIILVCEQGVKSAALALKLREQGFTNPLVLAGGMNAWQSASLPTVKGPTVKKPKVKTNTAKGKQSNHG
ncbi:MAG: hypothetical protein A3F46_06555 [Legionellales bacterium RIFCSPHIGHO2_12_FULL_42_9]|nr:MAG: hypothetical protein A3F46_06555 [Legionellales bacterium RIFCSPHIGHO2_12_FULL_42_9]